ncbi:MAG TPA: hypothetical protein VGL26_04270, partial [Jatrophihabitans sp.]
MSSADLVIENVTALTHSAAPLGAPGGAGIDFVPGARIVIRDGLIESVGVPEPGAPPIDATTT